MSFKADVLRVLIASPSDVSQERDQIERAIFDWNSQYADEMNVVLLPGRWENDVTPTYRGVEGGQAVINEQLVSNCDILVGVFWTKLGTPTFEHSSGTLEEISIFIDQGKEVMVYFVDRPVPRHGINYQELHRVDEFKEEYSQKGVYGTYDVQNLNRHLYNKVRDYKRKNQQSESEAANTVSEATNALLQEKIPEQQEVVSISDLISSGNLSSRELLLLSYIMENQDRHLGARWMAEETMKRINEWEAKNGLISDIAYYYSDTLSSLLERRLIEAEEYTAYGNAKLYKVPLDIFTQLINLDDQQINKIQSIVHDNYEMKF